MCLVTDWKEPKIAEKDIVCYKWYMTRYDDTYVSPYQGSLIPMFKVVTHTELDTPKIFNDTGIEYCIYKKMFDTDLIYLIHKGYHSFATCEGACSHATIYIPDSVIVTCIIPKGTKYYKGLFGGAESYCSEAIIIEKFT